VLIIVSLCVRKAVGAKDGITACESDRCGGITLIGCVRGKRGTNDGKISRGTEKRLWHRNIERINVYGKQAGKGVQTGKMREGVSRHTQMLWTTTIANQALKTKVL
jgi:hypothetical protein